MLATEQQRFGGFGDFGMGAGGMFSRPGSVMGGGGGPGSRLGFYSSLPHFGGPGGGSRPPSGMGIVPGGPTTGANR